MSEPKFCPDHPDLWKPCPHNDHFAATVPSTDVREALTPDRIAELRSREAVENRLRDAAFYDPPSGQPAVFLDTALDAVARLNPSPDTGELARPEGDGCICGSLALPKGINHSANCPLFLAAIRPDTGELARLREALRNHRKVLTTARDEAAKRAEIWKAEREWDKESVARAQQYTLDEAVESLDAALTEGRESAA